MTMDTMSATQMAKAYGLKSPQAFNKLLVKCGILTDTPKGHCLAEAYRGRGYVIAIYSTYFLPNGIKASKKKPVWTEAGQDFIRKALLHHGISPVSEQTDLFNN